MRLLLLLWNRIMKRIKFESTGKTIKSIEDNDYVSDNWIREHRYERID